MRKALFTAMILMAIAVLTAPAFAQAPNVLGRFYIGSQTSNLTGNSWGMEIDITSQNAAGQISGTVIFTVPKTALNPTGQITYACSGTVDAASHVTLSYGRFPSRTTLHGFYSERFRPIHFRFISGTYESWDYSRIPGRMSDHGTFSVGGP